MNVKEYLEKKVGKRIGIISSGLPKEHVHSGTLVQVESDIVIIRDDKEHEWVIPLDKVLLIGPPEMKDEGKTAGFRG